MHLDFHTLDSGKTISTQELRIVFLFRNKKSTQHCCGNDASAEFGRIDSQENFSSQNTKISKIFRLVLENFVLHSLERTVLFNRCYMLQKKDGVRQSNLTAHRKHGGKIATLAF